MRYQFALVALLITTSLATAQPLVTSMQPGKDKMSAPQLEDRSAKANPGAFPLLECLHSLVRGDTDKAEKSCSAALVLNALSLIHI